MPTPLLPPPLPGAEGTGSDPGASPASPDKSLCSLPSTQISPEVAQFPHSSPPAEGPHTPQCTRLPLAPVVAAWIRNMLGPLLTSGPCDIPLGSAEMVGFAEVGKGKGLGIRSSYNLFPHCPGFWASSALWWPSIRTVCPNHSGCRANKMRVSPLRTGGWFLPILLK